eukprot:3713539-Amphidinium_carterae.1
MSVSFRLCGRAQPTPFNEWCAVSGCLLENPPHFASKIARVLRISEVDCLLINFVFDVGMTHA